MLTVNTDATNCTPDFLIGELAKGDERDLLLRIAGISALMEADETHRYDSRLFNQLAATVLAMAFIEGAPRVRPHDVPLPIEQLFRLANGVGLSDSEIRVVGSELRERNCRMMVRLCAQHEAYLGPLKPALGRTEVLLGRILPAVLNGRPNPLDALRLSTGATYAEARAVFLGSYAWTIGRAPQAAPVITRHTMSGTSDPTRLWEVASSFAGTRTELKESRDANRGYGFRDGPDFRYAFSVLRDRPFVRLSSDELVAPIARHLSLAFSDGIYDFLAAHFSAVGGSAERNFNSIFGDVAEEYARERFERDLGAKAYKSLPELGNNELSPDGVTAEGDCVLELKGKRLLRGVITTGDIRSAPYFLGGKRGLGRGVAQLLSEIARTKIGKGRGLNKERLDDVVPCLVTPDGLPGFHLTPIRRWVLRAFDDVLRKDFPELRWDPATIQRLEWLSFDELDRLVRASRITGTSVGRLLRRYRFEAPEQPLDGRTNSWPPDLRSWLLQRYPSSNSDAWLDEAFSNAWDDCTQRMFGEPIERVAGGTAQT